MFNVIAYRDSARESWISFFVRRCWFLGLDDDVRDGAFACAAGADLVLAHDRAARVLSQAMGTWALTKYDT